MRRLTVFVPGSPGRAHGGGQVHRQSSPGERTQVGPQAVRGCDVIRPIDGVSLRGRARQIRNSQVK